MAADLRERIRQQLARGVHPRTGAPLTALERFAYTALLANIPAVQHTLAQLRAGGFPSNGPLPSSDPDHTEATSPQRRPNRCTTSLSDAGRPASTRPVVATGHGVSPPTPTTSIAE